LVQTVVDRFGRLDVLVNNVGDFRWGTLSDTSLDDWKGIFASNLMTVVYVAAHLCRTCAQGVGAHREYGRGGRGARLRASQDFRVCCGEGAVVAYRARWLLKKRRMASP